MSVYKRGDVYWYDFWFNGSHIRDSAHTNSKTIAKQAEQQRRRDLERAINRISKPARMPLFKIAANRLVEDKRARRAHNTGELYKYALKPVIQEFGGRLVCDISPEDIAAYQTKRLNAEMSPRTVNIEVGALRAVLKAHRLWGSISDAVEMLHERRDVGRALSYEDEKKLIEAAGKSRSPALLPLLVLTLDSGLRAAEIRALRRKDLHLAWKDGVIESGILTVPKSKTEAGTGRTIPLTRRACATFTLWLSRFPEADADTYIFPKHSVGVFGKDRRPHLYGVELSEPIGEWKKAWKDACTTAEVRYRWHDLRHTFITRLAERPEVSEQTIMSLAGHVSRSMLARYSHIRSQTKQAAISAVEDAAERANSKSGSPQNPPQSEHEEQPVLN
jgi:integrase